MLDDAETAIVRLDDACRALADARDVRDAKAIRDQAEAFRHWAKRRKLGRDAALDACEIKIWAERRMGELLAEMPPHVGGRPAKENRSHDGTGFPPTLAELGTTKNQSSRCQKIASVDVAAIRDVVAKVRADDRADLSTAAVLRLAKAAECDARRRENQALVESAEPLGEVRPDSGETFSAVAIDPPWDWGDEGDVSQFGRGDPILRGVP